MVISLYWLRKIKALKRDLFPALERKSYLDIRSARIYRDNRTLFYVVYDVNNPPRWWGFTSGGGSVEKIGNILDRPELPGVEIKITEDFWTCECSVHFIHHKAQSRCPICKLTVGEDTEYLRIVKG